MKRAWYLGHSADAVGDRAILVGDPGRVRRIAKHLGDATLLPVTRGLETVTGHFAGLRITVAAFGMGAPIATIVLHELADLGVTRFLRIGTAVHFSPATPGDLMISSDAIGFDGTSSAYVPGNGPYPADPALVAALRMASMAQGHVPRTGRYASYDAFYRDVFGIDDEGRNRAEINRRKLIRKSILAVDMETSALLAAAQALNVTCATVCLGTVDALTQESLGPDETARGEQVLFKTALDGLVGFD
ncbi:MAG: hypothetical protein OXF56_15195 [Rhodobacteraceae bacterium]|nr:hypothetical protein [Paracoccaceae bacterium]